MNQPTPNKALDALRSASQRKAAAAHQATKDALKRLRKTNQPITIAAVAREAGVSAHYLHQHPDFGPLIRQLRTTSTPGVRRPITTPDDQSGIVAVLKTRIEHTRTENQQLTARIHQLEQDLETARGEIANLQQRHPGE